jgi:hypothetical protein
MPQGLDLHRVKPLLDGPAPAVLATHRKDGSVKLSPVWFRHAGDYFEVVIADDDVKLKHITRDPAYGRPPPISGRSSNAPIKRPMPAGAPRRRACSLSSRDRGPRITWAPPTRSQCTFRRAPC